MDEYKQHLKECRFQPTTIRCYLTDLDQFIDFMRRRDSDASETTMADVQDFSAWLKESYRASTIHRKMSSIKCFLRWAERMNKNIYLVSCSIQIPQPDRTDRHRISSENLEKLFRNFRSGNKREMRDAAIYAMVLYCGCKISEALRSLISDIDLSTETLTTCPSGKTPSRQISISLALPYIKRYLTIREDILTGESLLFVNKDQKKLSDRSVRRNFQTYVGRAGFKSSTRELRNTFAFEQISQGVSMRTLSQKMGHLSVNTTHIYAKQLREAKS